MKITIEVYPNGLKDSIYRKIEVNSSLKLTDLCEYIIISLNGDGKHLYQLIQNEEYAYLGPGNNQLYENEEMMDDLSIEDILNNKHDKFLLNYDFKTDWEFIINILNINNISPQSDFNVIEGYGYGIIENIDYKELLYEYYDKKTTKAVKEKLKQHISKISNDLEKEFNIIQNNLTINEYKTKLKNIVKPKHYIMNVNLYGFEKIIKRKITVDSNVTLSKFCESVIYSMNGDLEHMYGIKIGTQYLEEEILNTQDLNYLELKEKQRFKIIYDYGDNWIFNITISKINDNYGIKPFMVTKAVGKGIEEDCGGVYGLYNLIANKDNNWGYDINDYDINEINNLIDMTF